MRMGSMCSVLAISTAMWGAAAHAQVAAAPAPASDAGVVAGQGAKPEKAAEIVVTGSRISRRDYVAQSPIVTQSADALQATGSTTIDKALLSLPQFQPGQGGFTNSSAGGQGVGLSSLNLRSLGPQRTLVLLDGHRSEPGNGLTVIDINSIPTSAISGVEVITGGASATYGSDAIAGVVNFKVYHQFQGIRLDAQNGISSRGDAASHQVSLIAGTKFAEGRGSIMVAGEYQQRDGLPYTSRDWSNPSRSFSNVIGNGVYAPGSNGPSQGAVDSVFAKYGISSGSVLRTDQLGFNQDGSLFRNRNTTTAPLNYKASSNPCMVVTSSVFAYDGLCLNLHQIPLTRYAALGRAEYKISPSVKVFAQVQYSRVTVHAQGSNPTLNPVGASGLTVPVTNPFIPADLKTLLASRANPNASFLVVKRFIDDGPRAYVNNTTTYQLLGGLEGDLPIKDWTFEFYGSHGHTSATDEVYSGAVSISAVQKLLAAPDGGASLCAGGFNIFGPEPVSASCAAYVAHPTSSSTTISQDEVAFNATGPVFSLPAGEVKLAVSAAYRRNSFGSSPDPAISAGDIAATTATQPLFGVTNVTEGAAEVLVPLLKDITLVKSLNLTGAYRYSKYNISGGVSSWKVGADWRVADPIMFRGGYQKAVRAPSVGELFQPLQGALANIGVSPAAGDPCDVRSTYRAGANAAQVRSLCIAQGVPAALVDSFNSANSGIQSSTAGNINLQPETAKTFTAGVVFQPTFLGEAFRRMSLSVDYYDIRLTSVISSVDVLTSVSKCFNADGSNPSYSASYILCQNLSRDPTTGQIAGSSQKLLNLGAYKTSGIDIVFDWSLPMRVLGLGNDDTLRLNVAATYLRNFDIQVNPGAPFSSYRGTITIPTGPGASAFARMKANTTIEYTHDKFSLGVKWTHVTGFKDVSTVTNAASTVPGTPTYDLFDLFGKVRVNDKFELRGGIQNVGDRNPPPVGGFNATNPGVYDTIGRAFFVGIKASI